MRTIPIAEVGHKLVVRYTRPEIDRNKDKTVRLSKKGHPKYSRAPLGFLGKDAYSVNVKKRFFLEHMLGKHALTPAQLKVFFHLSSGLRVSDVRIAYQPDGEPVPFDNDGKGVLAVMMRTGNRTRSETFSEIAEMVGVSVPEVRKAINEFVKRGLAKRIKADVASVQNRLGMSVREKDVVRLEIDPTYAWCGRVEDGLAYRDANRRQAEQHANSEKEQADA